MAKRQFQLTEEQIKEFRQYERQVTRVADLKRLQAVRLYGMGWGLQEIIDITGCGESTLRAWVKNYSDGGILSVIANYESSSQNARKLGTEQEVELCEKLRQYRPNQVLPVDGYQGTGQFWTVDSVRTVVMMWYGVSYSDMGSYRNLLHRCGFSYQRSEHVYKSRPSEAEIAEFEAQLEKK